MNSRIDFDGKLSTRARLRLKDVDMLVEKAKPKGLNLYGASENGGSIEVIMRGLDLYQHNNVMDKNLGIMDRTGEIHDTFDMLGVPTEQLSKAELTKRNQLSEIGLKNIINKAKKDGQAMVLNTSNGVGKAPDRLIGHHDIAVLDIQSNLHGAEMVKIKDPFDKAPRWVPLKNLLDAIKKSGMLAVTKIPSVAQN